MTTQRVDKLQRQQLHLTAEAQREDILQQLAAEQKRAAVRELQREGDRKQNELQPQAMTANAMHAGRQTATRHPTKLNTDVHSFCSY